MQHGAHIGPSVVIKGEVSAQEPLVVSGRVEGTIDVPGHVVTIEAGSQVTADVTAGGIVVSGIVQGSLAAEERIVLRAGAEVDGDLKAPRLAIEDGARASGRVTVAPAAAAGFARAS